MTSRNVTLTDAELREKTASELLDLLENVSADGVLTDAEIVTLGAWLESAKKDDVPAMAYLRGIVKDVLADRVVIADERRAIVAAILRVMPPDKRALAKVRFGEAEKSRKVALEADWKDAENQPATSEQVKFIQAMGVKVENGCTSAKASEFIENELTAKKPATPRQFMILRFWNRPDLAPKGRAGIDEWLDGFYAEDPDRLAAWEMWKSENGDCGRDDLPDRVIEGSGESYLDKVKDAKLPPPNRPLPYRITMTAIAVVLFLLVAYMIYKAGHQGR